MTQGYTASDFGVIISQAEHNDDTEAQRTCILSAIYVHWSGKNPTDRSNRGIKKNIIIDQQKT
jgi:hypothetical protein